VIKPRGARLAARCARCSFAASYSASARPVAAWRPIAGAGALLLLALIVFLSVAHFVGAPSPTTGRPVAEQTARAAGPIGTGPVIQQVEHWISANYRDLLDLDDLTRSGETVRDALARIDHSDARQQELQPFLEPMSRLLIDVVSARTAIAAPPIRDLANLFPRGARQPAWAALLRTGHLVIATEGDDSAVVFAPGDSSKHAYEAAYPAIRHALNALRPSDGRELTVRVFAFQNDFASCTLRFLSDLMEIRGSSFPPPSGKHSIDLDRLAQALASLDLTGATLGSGQDFCVVGQAPAQMHLHPDLADLAVAYRATFYSGHNSAFVSLDPHRDPTRAKVNFGGLLEDTWVGTVVLEADKRFKTITCGLDPNSHNDLRSYLRAVVPVFATAAERDLASGDFTQTGWVGTRFWYYPDSVEVETDLSGRLAAIREARFTADAERSREDFASATDFDLRKKAALSASTRDSISTLNAYYGQFASVLQPLQNLESVAKVMGLCSWLRRAPTSDVDLDSLLAVDLPESRTPDDTNQLIATTAVMLPAGREASSALDLIREASTVTYLTPLLDQTVGQVFGGYREDLARFLALSAGRASDDWPQYLSASDSVLQAQRSTGIRALLRTKQDLRAFAEVTAGRCEAGQPPQLSRMESELQALRSELDDLENRIKSLKAEMDLDVEVHNALVSSYNALIDLHHVKTNDYNSLVSKYNTNHFSAHFVFEIGGGIDMSPEHFRVRAAPDSELITRARTASTVPPNAPIGSLSGLEQVSCISARDVAGEHIPRERVQLEKIPRSTGGNRVRGESPKEGYWFGADGPGGDWSDQESLSDGGAVGRFYDSRSKTLHVAQFGNGACLLHRTMHEESPDHFVFKRADARVKLPQTPPSWWGAPTPN
jgi:hypothetical protein